MRQPIRSTLAVVAALAAGAGLGVGLDWLGAAPAPGAGQRSVPVRSADLVCPGGNGVPATVTVAAPPDRAGTTATGATPVTTRPAASGTLSASASRYPPSAPAPRTRAVVSASGDSRYSVCSPLPAGTAGTTVVRLGAADTGSQSEPYPVSERYSLSSTPAATRPVRDSTCSATAATPSSSAMRCA